jgi:tRNA pseudouridine(55) synthase
VGIRSSDCVERIKRILGRGAKVGHGGTLDSTAAGVLVLLLGGATRLSDYVMLMPKRYRTVIKLGEETTTCDGSGEVTREADASGIGAPEVDAVIPGFVGWRMQTPPEVSAVRVNGRRAHEIFRSGLAPDIAPRPVFVESIERTAQVANHRVELLVRCGKGTYVRALARDMGRRLGCGAHVASLTREAVGPFSLAGSLDPGADFQPSREDVSAAIRPLDVMGEFLPRYSVGAGEERALTDGREVPLTQATRVTPGLSCPAALALVAGNSLVAVADLVTSRGGVAIRPRVNIARVSS